MELPRTCRMMGEMDVHSQIYLRASWGSSLGGRGAASEWGRPQGLALRPLCSWSLPPAHPQPGRFLWLWPQAGGGAGGLQELSIGGSVCVAGKRARAGRLFL